MENGTLSGEESLSLTKNEKMNKVCGNCKYHQFENIDNGYVCVNPDSDNLSDWTEYDDSCEDWEEKE